MLNEFFLNFFLYKYNFERAIMQYTKLRWKEVVLSYNLIVHV
jgi:hypothetical protein